MNQEKIKALFENEEFVKELFSKETPEEVQEMLVENDVEISVEEIVKLKELLAKKLEQGDENLELTEEELEDVSGGFASAIAMGVGGLLLIGVLGIYVDAWTDSRW